MSSSDKRNPFLDPIVPVPYNAKHAKHPRSAPLPPTPQQAAKQTMLEAVRDTVVRPEGASRSKVSRSQTSAVGGAAQPASSSPRERERARRSMSQDSVLQAAAAAEKARAAKTSSKAGKKGGVHTDVIDRLDFTGVGSAMFHHDGPFDACAPSRNRHRTKAPMLAWTPESEDPNAHVEPAGVPTTTGPVDRRLSPLAQATISAMARSGAGDSPYPTSVSPPPPKLAKGQSRSIDGYFPDRPYQSERKKDVLAEAWGKAEPEPYEEFFASAPITNYGRMGETGLASAASSIHGGVEGHSSTNGSASNSSSRRGKDRPVPTRKATNLPPPQPIDIPGAINDNAAYSDYSSSMPTSGLAISNQGQPKRSKSLMQRIRKMRDTPNIPVGYDDEPTPTREKDPSPPSSENNHGGANGAGRPTHRHQNSLLGRFGAGGRKQETAGTPLGNISPSPDNSAQTSPTAATFSTDKALPTTPDQATPTPQTKEEASAGYFGTSPKGEGMARKTSIMKKVKGVVGGRGGVAR